MFKDEKDFAKEVKRQYEKDGYTCFFIETEETIAGFPDLLCVPDLLSISPIATNFVEIKITNKSGCMQFQKSQVSFFKQNSTKLYLTVVVYDRKSNKVYRCFNVSEIVTYCIENETLSVNIDKIISKEEIKLC